MGLSRAVQQPGHVTDNSLPLTAKPKNMYSHTLVLHTTSLNAKGKVYFNFIIVSNFPDYCSPPLLLTISSSLLYYVKFEI
jgi:hypothetical protein